MKVLFEFDPFGSYLHHSVDIHTTGAVPGRYLGIILLDVIQRIWIPLVMPAEDINQLHHQLLILSVRCCGASPPLPSTHPRRRHGGELLLHLPIPEPMGQHPRLVVTKVG